LKQTRFIDATRPQPAWPALGRPPQLSAKDAAAPLLADATLLG